MTTEASAADAMVTARHNADGSATFESLLKPILETAYGMALHMTRNRADAEDVVQEAALHAFRAFGSFQPGTNFNAWFLRILTNAFLSRCREARREAGTASLDGTPEWRLYARTHGAGLHDEDSNTARTFLSRLEIEDITAAVQALPVEYRTVTALYFLEDFSYAEIASILGCPVGTVRSRLHRGRRMLQQALWRLAEDHGIVQPAGDERNGRLG